MYADLYQSVLERFGSSTSGQPMSEWVVENTNHRGRKFSFTGYEFQKAITDDLHPEMSVVKPSQVGLALALDTPIPTPTGWVTMGELKEGDLVFDEQGQPCEVNYVSPVYIDHTCYEVEFDTGEVITADAGHRWYVETDFPFDLTGKYDGKGHPPKSCEMFHEGVLDTETISKFYKRGDRNRFAIPNARRLELPDKELPVDPYFLGLWLGDGNSCSATLTAHTGDMDVLVPLLAKKNLVATLSSRKGATLQVTIRHPDQVRVGRGAPYSVYNDLRLLGLIQGRKYIPEMYLRASTEQRFEILRGLMDRDGTITKRGRCSFYNTNHELVSGFQDLIHSLGFKAHTRWRLNPPSVMKNGHVITPKHSIAEVSFVAYAEDKVFHLPRKLERLRPKAIGRSSETLRRRITRVTPTPTIPVRCIQVNSPNHLFLAGKGMIPTHNTEVQLRKFLAMLARNAGCAGIFSMPNGNMLKRTYNARLKPIIDGASIFNPPGLTPVRRYDQVQIRDSFGYLTGCTDGDATSTSADFLMHDEVDLSPMDILDLYQSRLQNSDMKITQRFSTPTWGGYGIDKFYQMSDQREYFMRCQSCNHEQIPDFTPKFVKLPGVDWDVSNFLDLPPESILNLDTHEAFLVCERCGRRLDIGNPGLRQWVARFSTRTAFRGYRVRPFSTVRLSPGYIFGRLAKALNEGTVRHYRNTVLGETHNSSDSQIQRGDIETCMSSPTLQEVGHDTLVYIGLDVGFTCYMTLSFDDAEGRPVFFHFESFPMALVHDKIVEMRKRYNIARGAADRFPFEPDVDALRVTTSDLIMPIQYRGTNPLAPVKDELGSITHYSANPTFHLDRIHTMIGQHSLVLAGYGHQKETLMTHLTDNVRDERPDQPATWRKNPGEDHYFHAMAFGMIARRIHEHAILQDSHVEPKVSAMLVAATQNTPQGLLGLSGGRGSGFRRVSRLGSH